MTMGDTFGGAVSLGNIIVILTILSCSNAGGRRDFFKPPSPCLTGPSCKLCQDTVKFFHRQVCCYHCRLDNVVINNDQCHCINTALRDPVLAGVKVHGNCSVGKVCDNCAVRMSSDASLGAQATLGVLSYCCQDCGLLTPYFRRDEHGCHCAGDPQGREHQAAPRYDPSQDPSTTPPVATTSNTATPLTSSCRLSSVCYMYVLMGFSSLCWQGLRWLTSGFNYVSK